MMKSSVPHMLDKPKETSLRDGPWRAALVASAPVLVAIALVALAVWRRADSALNASPDLQAAAQHEIIGAACNDQRFQSLGGLSRRLPLGREGRGLGPQ